VPDIPSFLEIVLRLLVAFALGAAIGLEREQHLRQTREGRGPGMRTYSLICFGSCVFTVASLWGFPVPASDPSRVASQVVTGVGFLGAGAILKEHGEVRGLTTAAGIWVAAAQGLLIGVGMYGAALVAAVLAYLILSLHHIFPGLYRSLDDE